jgi:hypothetical protein
MIRNMAGSRDYQKDFERTMAEVENKDARRLEQFSKDLLTKLELARKQVGMRPKEMWAIIGRDGVQAALDEIKRRSGAQI